MRRSMQWSKQLKDLRDKLAVEQAKVEFNQQPNGTASDMKGLSGAAEKIKYSFDRDDELAFKAPVKVSTRLVYATRSYDNSVLHI